MARPTPSPWAAVLLAVLPAAPGADAPAMPLIRARPGEELSFSVGGGKAGEVFEIAAVLRDGAPAAIPKGLQLDRKTGRVRWTPRNSQAGRYELRLLAYDRANPRGRRIARQIVVQPNPVTTDRGSVGTMLRQWYAEGTAAGNVGDYYDNRDRGHSRLDLKKFPQLDRVEYPEAIRQRRGDWALQRFFIYPHVTLGNSSTASAPTRGGSNARWAMMGQAVADVMYRQYTHNMLYVYPEHRDHDPGRNGRGGYGDLFPANTPYLLISQGSSGSDRAFLEAVAFTLAAFRPDVKKKLVAAGLLMPTIQMLLRASLKTVRRPEDYLTGRAHPTVFDGTRLDPLKMVRKAHAITVDAVPPAVRLRVLEEDLAVEGRDFIDPGHVEKLFDTPSAVARIGRARRYERRMTVAAEGSDLNGRPLTFHWSVLRGDPNRVRIRPTADDASRIELTVAWHGPRPVEPGSGITSPRVDIGCFARNGKWYSAPAFVTVYFPPNQARTYDESGRLVEIAWNCGDSTIGYPTTDPRAEEYDITDWLGLLELAAAGGQAAPEAGGHAGLAAELIARRLSGPALRVLRDARDALAARRPAEAGPREAYRRAVEARRKALAAETEARRRLAQARKDGADPAAAAAELKRAVENSRQAYQRYSTARRDLLAALREGARILTRPQPRLKGSQSVKDRIEAVLNDIRGDVGLYFDRPDRIEALAKACPDEARRAFLAAREKLIREGVAEDDGRGRLRLTPARTGAGPPARRLTAFERNRIEWFNIALMQSLLLGGRLKMTFRADYADPRLTTPRTWRDVFHYDPVGRLTGWTRYQDGKRHRFTAHGHLVETTDPLGRARTARAVRYTIERDTDGLPKDLKWTPVEGHIRYVYASGADRVGRPRTP